ncbi:peptidase inhibitor family I36 protein [Bacillus sp. FSL R12-0069]|uniref:peptidase inhibitor family I36 protein n=1 Tax=Bacillus sp. FSL R12-0069 TaxID=2975342 RepID=UPI0030F93DEF
MYYNSYEYNTDVQHTNFQQFVNRFYEHINGTGMSFTLNSGSNLPYVGNPWNDKISSVSVAPKTLVILYKDAKFGPPVKILENSGNIPYLFNIHKDFNDVVSSIKTFRIW